MFSNLRLSSHSIESKIQKYSDTLNSSLEFGAYLDPVDSNTIPVLRHSDSYFKQDRLVVVAILSSILFNLGVFVQVIPCLIIVNVC